MVDVETKLARQGIDGHGDVVTSAMAAAGLLQPGERALLVGGPGIREALEARGVEVVLDGDADAVVVGLDLAFTYERMRIAATAVRRGAWLVATNDDATYPTADGLWPGAGAVLAGIERATGAVATVAGKPYAPMADLLRARYGSTGTLVGDRPDTDGRLARVLGYRWALVLSGITSSLDPPPDPEPDVVAPTLSDLVASELASR